MTIERRICNLIVRVEFWTCRLIETSETRVCIQTRRAGLWARRLTRSAGIGVRRLTRMIESNICRLTKMIMYWYRRLTEMITYWFSRLTNWFWRPFSTLHVRATVTRGKALSTSTGVELEVAVHPNPLRFVTVHYRWQSRLTEIFCPGCQGRIAFSIAIAQKFPNRPFGAGLFFIHCLKCERAHAYVADFETGDYKEKVRLVEKKEKGQYRRRGVPQ